MRQFFGNDRYEKWMIAFCVIFLGSLLYLNQFHEIGGYAVETDFYGAFAPGAKALMEGRVELDPGYGPGYEVMLIFFYLFVRDMFAAGKIISILSTVLMCFLTFKLLARLFDSKLAFFAALPLAFVLLPWSVVASTDVFFALLVTGCLYFLLKDKKIEFKHLVLSGLLAGFIYITRHNGIAVFPAIAVIILLINPDNLPWLQRLKSCAVFLGFALLIMVPWMITNYLVNDGAFQSDSYLIIASHFYGRPGVTGADDLAAASQKFNSLFDVVFYDFKHFVFHYLGNLYRHFRDVLQHSLTLPVGLFVLPGLLLLLKNITKRQAAYASFPIFGFLLLCLVHYEPRYYLFLVAFFLFYAVYFFFGSWQAEAASGFFRIAHRGVYLAAILFLAVDSSRALKAVLTTEPLELQEVAEYLKSNAQKNDIIIARKPHLGYLSDLKTVYFPQAASLAELLTFAKNINARYILYGEIEMERRPHLQELLNYNNGHSELQMVYSNDHPNMALYKINNN